MWNKISLSLTLKCEQIITWPRLPAGLYPAARWASCTCAAWNPILIQKRFGSFAHLICSPAEDPHTPEPIPGHFLLRSSNKSHAHTHSQKSYESLWSLLSRSVYNEKFMRVLLHRWREEDGRKRRDVLVRLARQQASLEPNWSHSLFIARRKGLCNIYLWYWLDCEWLPAYSPSHTLRWDHNPTAETACFPRARFN